MIDFLKSSFYEQACVNFLQVLLNISTKNRRIGSNEISIKPCVYIHITLKRRVSNLKLFFDNMMARAFIKLHYTVGTARAKWQF